MVLSRHFAALPAAALLLALPLLGRAEAQSLRGSRASIDRMYRQAIAEDLSFFETPASVRRQAAAGRLVALSSGRTYTLHRVTYPWVRPETRTFVERLAEQYVDACGERLVVTSATRPATRQPANSADRSVHPTGMAVDLRKPADLRCRRWLRSVLLELEEADVLEATEEHAPPHFHVAVFPTPYGRYAAARTRDEARVAVAARPAASPAPTTPAVYVVRRGDTLWDIAQMHDTTVAAIMSANRLRAAKIRPGQKLRIPTAD